jgi:MFS family permease
LFRTQHHRRYGLDLPPHRRVFAAFFLYACAMGGIFPRLGDIQLGLGVAEGALGLALIGTATGTLISLSLAGPLIERVGHRRTLLALIPLMALLFALAALASSPAMLFACLLPAGLCIGAVEIVVNLEADRVEMSHGRRLMNRAHAFWSFGFVGASLLASTLSQAGVSPALHLLMVLPPLLLGQLLWLGRFESAPHRVVPAGASAGAQAGVAAAGPAAAGSSADQAIAASAPPPARLARPTWAILVLVALCLSAMLLEGAGADWSAIYMRDVFGVSPFIAGSAVTVGALTQALTRYVADRFVDRHSPVRVARALLSVLGAGATLVLLAPSPAAALLGFAMMGVGTSAIFPLAMSAAAQRHDRPAAVNVASLAQTAFVAFLLGPPLLGFVAEHAGVRWSFGVCLPLVALSLLATRALHQHPPAREPAAA